MLLVIKEEIVKKYEYLVKGYGLFEIYNLIIHYISMLCNKYLCNNLFLISIVTGLIYSIFIKKILKVSNIVFDKYFFEIFFCVVLVYCFCKYVLVINKLNNWMYNYIYIAVACILNIVIRIIIEKIKE